MPMNIAERLVEASAHYGRVLASVDGYDVIDCRACGFRHIDPLFTDAELKKFYEQEFYESGRPDYFERMEADKEWWMLRYHHYELLEAHASGRRILDIGSGPGYFLEAGRECGWQVLGFEPSRIAAEYTRARGLAVVNDFFSAAKAREHGPFDVISLSMVLEHVRDPIGLIEEARSLLVPGGLLLLISPNDFNPLQMTLWEASGLSALVGQSQTSRLNYFDTASAGSFLKARRFEILHLETSYPLENFLLAGRNYVDNPALGQGCHKERKAFETALFRHDKGAPAGLGRILGGTGIGRRSIILSKKADR